MNNVADVLRSLKPNARRAYDQAYRDLLKFLGDERRLMTLTTADLQAWVADQGKRGLAAATIRTRLSAVSALFEENDPTAAVKRPALKPVPQTANLDCPEDVTKLLRAIDLSREHGAQDFALLGVLLLTGWGVERVRTLCWADFVIRGGQVWLRDSAGNIPLPRSLWDMITRVVRNLHGVDHLR